MACGSKSLSETACEACHWVAIPVPRSYDGAKGYQRETRRRLSYLLFIPSTSYPTRCVYEVSWLPQTALRLPYRKSVRQKGIMDRAKIVGRDRGRVRVRIEAR